MMTKEEVASIVAYCAENNISQKQRLAELGINEWQFYSSKRKYAPKRGGDNAGEFLQLVPGGAFLPDPIKPARMYVLRTVRHKLVLKSSLKIKDPDRRAPAEMYGFSLAAYGRHTGEVHVPHAVLPGDTEV